MPWPPLNQNVEKEIRCNDIRSAFLAQLYDVEKSGESLIEDYREKAAKALYSAGLQLIPSDHLQDHQFVVSRGVYKAAQKLESTAPGQR